MLKNYNNRACSSCSRLNTETLIGLKHVLRKHPEIFDKIVLHFSSSGNELADDKENLVAGLPLSKLNKVTCYIENNLKNTISIPELSGLLGMSSYHFVRLFKISTGKTPYQYVICRRIEKAKQYLEETNLSIIDIALEVGYESNGNFISSFKKITGITPYSYRKKL